jgi:AcrR family transcriptional regulator
MVEHGFASVTMDQIATASGITRSTLYTYFRDKSAILEAIAEDYIEVLLPVIDSLPSPKASPEQVRIWIAEYVEFVSAQPAPAELVMAVSLKLDPPPAIQAFGNTVMAALARRSSAFAAALCPGEDFRLAWARATLAVLGSALTFAAKHGPTGEAQSKLEVAAMLFTHFIHDDRH